MPPTIDPQAVALARAIKHNETGDSSDAYTAHGKSGEFGAYQFMPDTYKNYAQKYLGDANAAPSVENQNKIAYSFVAEKKKAGYNPAQILSMWNAGEGEPDAYTGKFSNGAPSTGTNGHGVPFDVPQYAAKGSQYYKQFAGQPTVAQDGSVPVDQTATVGPLEEGITNLGNQLGARFQKAGDAVSDAFAGKDKAPLISAPLQVIGQGAGAIGDVVNAGLELIPGVKQAEGLLGKGITAAAATPIGQKVVQGVQDFSTAHPELSKNIAAAGNIATLLPAGKALGLAKDAVGVGIAKAGIKGTTKAAEEELGTVIGSTVKGRGLVANAGKRGINPVKDMLENKILPEVTENAEGKSIYSTAKADELASHAESIQEDNLQQLAKSASNNPISIKQARNTAIAEARKELGFDPDLPKIEQSIRETFDHWESRFGDKQTLSTLIDMKRAVRKGLSDKNFMEQTAAAKKAALYTGQGLMKSIEDTASSRGIVGTLESGAQAKIRDINQTLARIINVRKALSQIEGKAVKSGKSAGWLREISGDLAGAGGEFVGGMTGIPFAGTLAGRTLGNKLAKNAPKSALVKLQKASAGKFKIPSILGGISPLAAQHANNSRGQ